ncbi:hypothetical protein B0T16DRAFT_20046 [Cercophora newfieldiana]|uniref:Uncharacterized protein n=1 Tax=Cercophora newfieldiana TaxID=92897 RepID=A0AA39YQC2_9PEZI|nr:hypothetical protein B0T16DRAFT_20046 [Cercophora newfieldiana]
MVGYTTQNQLRLLVCNSDTTPNPSSDYLAPHRIAPQIASTSVPITHVSGSQIETSNPGYAHHHPHTHLRLFQQEHPAPRPYQPDLTNPMSQPQTSRTHCATTPTTTTCRFPRQVPPTHPVSQMPKGLTPVTKTETSPVLHPNTQPLAHKAG